MSTILPNGKVLHYRKCEFCGEPHPPPAVIIEPEFTPDGIKLKDAAWLKRMSKGYRWVQAADGFNLYGFQQVACDRWEWAEFYKREKPE